MKKMSHQQQDGYNLDGRAADEFDHQYRNPVHGHTVGVTDGLGISRSSSSEDDGQGGTSKKGLKEKIQDKLPGQGHNDEQAYQTGTNYTTPGGAGEGHVDSSGQYRERKGMVETIKDKLPLSGSHHH